MKYEIIHGDLIDLALKGNFDVIAHGCNCQCVMKSGIAVDMAKFFEADVLDCIFTGVYREYFHNDPSNKLGNIDWHMKIVGSKELAVVNAYTQLHWNGRSLGKVDLDYEALTLCMRKINRSFRGKHIGLPQIGCGLAGGDWSIVEEIIKKELKDCDVTIVIYKK